MSFCRRATHAVLGFAALFGGCQCEVKRVVVGFKGCVSDTEVTVGDSFDVWAGAYASENPVGFSLLFDSQGRPGRFRWSADPESVATITPAGRVSAVRTGTLAIRATVDNVTGERVTTVVPASGRVGFEVPASIRVGDTVRIDFQLLDTQGQMLPPTSRAQVYPEPNHLIEGQYDTSFTQAVFTAERSGTTSVYWCFSGRTGMLRLTILP